jgi:hypothetical protein
MPQTHAFGKPLMMAWLALFLGLLVPQAVRAAPADLPDPVFFRTQMELGLVGKARDWLDAGLPPNFMGDRIGSGLMIGAWEGNLPLMELFLARGADINKTNALGETALMQAAWKGRQSAVEWLLARGAKVNMTPKNWSALHYAVFAGHTAIVDLLLARGADINAQSPNGSSVLMMAVYEGHEDLAKKLLQKGADTRIRNENGDGALQWAMKFNHTAIARMVSSQQEFAAAASRPRADWGQVQRSEPIPKELEDLLAIRETLLSRGMAVDKLDRRIAAMRAQFAREALKKQAPPAATTTLEITAERKASGKQRSRLIIDPAKPAVGSRL